MKNRNFLRLFSVLLLSLAIVACSSSKDDPTDPKKEPGEEDKTLVVTPKDEIKFNFFDTREVELGVTTDADKWDVTHPAWVKVEKKTDKAIVTVDNNTGAARSGELKFTATGAKDQIIKVSQEAYVGAPASLKGSNYYLIALDDTSLGYIKDKVVADYRVDDETRFLYVWDGTYDGGSAVGPNAFGFVEGWTSLVYNGSGWAGAGFAINAPIDMSAIDETYTFHFAIKGVGSHVVRVNGGNGVAYKITIGTEAVDDNLPPIKDISKEWQIIEVPVADMLKAGWAPINKPDGDNVVTLGSKSIANMELNIDAIFFYKKP